MSDVTERTQSLTTAEKIQSLTSAFLGSRWNSNIGSYQNVEAVTFRTERDLERAIESFWNDPALQGAPRIHAGDLTVFMPAEAAEYLDNAGIHLKRSELVDDDEPVKKRTPGRQPR